MWKLIEEKGGRETGIAIMNALSDGAMSNYKFSKEEEDKAVDMLVNIPDNDDLLKTRYWHNMSRLSEINHQKIKNYIDSKNW